MKKQICIWKHQPLNEHTYKLFGIERFIQLGFEVSFWDFTPWLAPRLWEHSRNKVYKIDNYILIGSWNDYERLINNSKGMVAIDLIGPRKETNDINQKALDNGIQRIKCWQSIVTRHIFTPDFWNKLSITLKVDPLFLLKMGMNKLFRFLLQKELNAIEPDFYICSGEFSINMIREDSASEIIWAHSWDYNEYLETNERYSKIIDEDYVVFIDSATPFHVDFLLTGRKNVVTADKYYPSLNKFLDHVENRLNLPVVVAAHPTSPYEKVGNLYGGRRIIKNRTAQLVRDSKLVITQSSTSDDFAVLWRKPLLIITTNEKLNTYSRWNLNATCKALKTDYINVDTYKGDIDLWELSQKPLNRYDFYRNGFIKRDETPEKNSWDILIDHLK